MTKYREILRLTALGLKQRDIMKSLGIAQKTVVKIQKRAKELSLSWPLDDSYTDAELERVMFPKNPSTLSTKRMPDYDYIRKELLRNGVNKKLLWTEYCCWSHELSSSCSHWLSLNCLWSCSVSTSSCSRCPQTLFQKPVDIETARTRGCVLFL